MKEGDIVLYLGKHPILKESERYQVKSANETDIQLVTETGFAGVPITDVILVQIKG